MAFTRLSIQATRPESGAGHDTTAERDIWAIFRALRDTRALFGLRPGHVQTLQAMLSFLRPGHGETVFASNREICRRVGGIDERTLRRHIDRFIALGFMHRQDSPNCKRYRVTSSDGDSISFGLSLAPLMQRAGELLAAAQEQENARRDRLFLRKQILTKLAVLDEAQRGNTLSSDVRRTLRRNLSLAEYRALLSEITVVCEDLSTTVDVPEPCKLPANDGHNVRHHSRSIKEQKDMETPESADIPTFQELTAVCDQAVSFSATPLDSWVAIESHARILAPMVGIHITKFEKALKEVGSRKASCAIFLILQLGSRIRDFAAYFHSVTLGRRRSDFDPSKLVAQLLRNAPSALRVHRGGHARHRAADT
ncbi:plasmid replication protein RepC [Tropicibacter sp. S64]|uniref:plasmid replication protein RepC n=1 Tax=Tropicibacter sp. S64 TaxID=3415122 RepID=UPI003C7BBA90